MDEVNNRVYYIGTDGAIWYYNYSYNYSSLNASDAIKLGYASTDGNNKYSIYPVAQTYYNASSNLTLSADKKMLYYKGTDYNLWYYFTDQENSEPNWNRRPFMYNTPIQGPIVQLGADNNSLFYVDNDSRLDWAISVNGDNPVRCQYGLNSTDQNNYKFDSIGTFNDTVVTPRLSLGDSSFQVTAYPNPSENSFTISITGVNNSNNHFELKIYSMQVSPVYTTSSNMTYGSNHYTFIWDASKVSNGIYFYTLKEDNGLILTGKLVKM